MERNAHYDNMYMYVATSGSPIAVEVSLNEIRVGVGSSDYHAWCNTADCPWYTEPLPDNLDERYVRALLERLPQSDLALDVLAGYSGYPGYSCTEVFLRVGTWLVAFGRVEDDSVELHCGQTTLRFETRAPRFSTRRLSKTFSSNPTCGSSSI